MPLPAQVIHLPRDYFDVDVVEQVMTRDGRERSQMLGWDKKKVKEEIMLGEKSGEIKINMYRHSGSKKEGVEGVNLGENNRNNINGVELNISNVITLSNKSSSVDRNQKTNEDNIMRGILEKMPDGKNNMLTNNTKAHAYFVDSMPRIENTQILTTKGLMSSNINLQIMQSSKLATEMNQANVSTFSTEATSAVEASTSVDTVKQVKNNERGSKTNISTNQNNTDDSKDSIDKFLDNILLSSSHTEVSERNNKQQSISESIEDLISKLMKQDDVALPPLSNGESKSSNQQNNSGIDERSSTPNCPIGQVLQGPKNSLSDKEINNNSNTTEWMKPPIGKKMDLKINTDNMQLPILEDKSALSSHDPQNINFLGLSSSDADEIIQRVMKSVEKSDSVPDAIKNLKEVIPELPLSPTSTSMSEGFNSKHIKNDASNNNMDELEKSLTESLEGLDLDVDKILSKYNISKDT